MGRIFAYLTPKWVGLGIVGVLALLYGVSLLGSGDTYEVIVVTPGEFVQQVSASGTVTPVQEVDLGFTKAGRIARVNVKVGDTVRQGAVLAALDNGDESATLQQKLAALAVQEAKLASLKQGTRPEEIAVAEASVASAEVALAQANQALIDAIRDAYIQSDDAIRNALYAFVTSPRSASPKLVFPTVDTQIAATLEGAIVGIERELTSWYEETAALSPSASAAAAYNAQAHLQSVSNVLATASLAVARGIPTASISQATLNAYASDIASSRAAVNAAASALTSAITAQRAAAASLDSARKNLALKRAGAVQADIDAQEAQVLAAKADVESARVQLAKTQIVAPFTGTVTAVEAKPGKVVAPNTDELSLISAGAFQIESYVPEVNIVSIGEGNRAEVTLDAYRDEVFQAKVVSIDPAATIRDGVPMYRVILLFEGADARIKSGMTANIRITTARKENTLSVPQGVITMRDGVPYVRVLRGEEIEERKVTVGLVSSLGNIEVLSGLAPGDQVVVSE